MVLFSICSFVYANDITENSNLQYPIVLNNKECLSNILSEKLSSAVIYDELSQYTIIRTGHIENSENNNINFNYIKKDCFNINNPDNYKYLSLEISEKLNENQILYKYNINEDFYQNFPDIFGKNKPENIIPQLYVIKQNNDIIWYRFFRFANLLCFENIDNDTIVLCYEGIFFMQQKKLYIEIIHKNDKNIIEQFEVFPIDLNGASYDIFLKNIRFVSEKIIKIDLNYISYTGEKNNIVLLLMYNYQTNKEFVNNYIIKNKKSYRYSPLILWISDKDNNQKLTKRLQIDCNYYFNEIISDTEPTIEQLKEKFPNDTFF